MRRVFPGLLALFIVILFLSNSSLFSQIVIVTGRVKYGDEVLQSASVTLNNNTNATDRSGVFIFRVNPGNYSIEITHTGFRRLTTMITVSGDSIQNYEFDMIPNGQLEEVAVLGSRSGIERSNLNAPVPVDVFTSDKLIQTGQPDLIQMLNFAAPSLTAARQIGYEPITLRGLDPHHTLILINGIRYHNTAVINNGVPKSNMGRGSPANDVNSIPFMAIEKVEILRDGATAQYGSDGIAGILNIKLKESAKGFSIQTHAGQYYQGDGFKVSFGLNGGVSLRKKGFLTYSANVLHRDLTARGGEFTGTIYYNIPTGTPPADSARIKALDDSLVLARRIDRKKFSIQNGNAAANSYGFLVNGGYTISHRSELFWTGSVNYLEKLAIGSFRFPKNIAQVNTDIYPDGFYPELDSKCYDVFLIGGLKTETGNGGHLKLISSYGSNSNALDVSNSNNASMYFLGKNAPTEFYLGKLIYKLNTNEITFTKDLAKTNENVKSCNLHLGTEFRIENYLQKAGDEASWRDYDSTGPRQGGSQPSIGSINPQNLVNENRHVLATYADLETETKFGLLIDVAGRYEYYSDFGGNLAGKLSTRYKITEKFSLRASISNGFRAPGIQQRFYEGTQSFRGTSLIQGIFSNNSDIAKAFGIPSLEAEKSVNISAGVMAKLSPHISLTADLYWIQIKDRIVLSGVFRKDNPDVATILAARPDVDVVQFYTNAINTRTYGIDMVLNGSWTINKAILSFILAANFNRNTIFGNIKAVDKITNTERYANTLFGIEEKTALEHDQPGEKIIFSGTASKGRFQFLFRNTFFGKTASSTINTNPADTLYEVFSSKNLTDVSIRYRLKSSISITVGANNIFDVYPDPLKNPGGQGVSIYSNGASPFGYNGGYYFVNMSFNF